MKHWRDILFPGLFGMALAVVGYPFTTWQYWLLFVLALAWRFTRPAVQNGGRNDGQ